MNKIIHILKKKRTYLFFKENQTFSHSQITELLYYHREMGIRACECTDDKVMHLYYGTVQPKNNS